MEKEFIETKNAPEAVGPYSQGVKVGNIIFTSGQLPIVPETGDMIKDDIRKATIQSLNNMLAVIEAGGGTLKDIVKVNIYVKTWMILGLLMRNMISSLVVTNLQGLVLKLQGFQRME